MDWSEGLRLHASGADVRRKRKDRADHGQRSPEQVRELREQAAVRDYLCRLLRAARPRCHGDDGQAPRPRSSA